MHFLLRMKGKATITFISPNKLKATMSVGQRLRLKKKKNWSVSNDQAGAVDKCSYFPFCYDSRWIFCVGVGLDTLGVRCCWMLGVAAIHNGSTRCQQNHRDGAQGGLCVCVLFQGSLLMGTCTVTRLFDLLLTSPQQGLRHSTLLDKERTGVVQWVTIVPSFSSSSLSLSSPLISS